VHDPAPAERVTAQTVVTPTFTSTVPVGVPLPGAAAATDTLAVTIWPETTVAPGERVKFVDVDAGSTVRETGLAAEVVKSVEPT
jgi:hypothetical protein